MNSPEFNENSDGSQNVSQLPQPKLRRATWLLLSLLLVIALLASHSLSQPISRLDQTPTVTAPTGELLSVYEASRPATVRIEGRLANRDIGGPLGVGTGFFISEDGLLLTAYHVIDSTSIREAVNYIAVDVNENEYPLELVGFDAYLDLALLKADISSLEGNLNYLELASQKPKVGSQIVAIGNSRGDFLEARAGKVNRLSVNSPRITFANNTIELTAALQPGDSGGPVLNRNGNVVGVVSYISYNPDALTDNASIDVPQFLRGLQLPDFAAYAVPALEGSETLASLLAGEGKDVPVIGFTVGISLGRATIQDYDPTFRADGFPDLGDSAGVIVRSVQDQGPAFFAGFQDVRFLGDTFEADVITAIDNESTPDFYSLLEVLYRKGVGETVEVTLQRGGETLKVRLELGAKRQVFN